MMVECAIFGANLKARRNALGLTLRDVEDITKGRVSNAYLSQLENGRIQNPGLQVLVELSSTYALPIEQMAEWLNVKAVAEPPVRCQTCGQVIRYNRIVRDHDGKALCVEDGSAQC